MSKMITGFDICHDILTSLFGEVWANIILIGLSTLLLIALVHIASELFKGVF